MSPALWCGTLPAGPDGFRWFVCLIKRTSLAVRLCCRLHEPNACVFHITTWSPPISTLNLTGAGRRLSGHGMPVDRAIAHEGEGDPCKFVCYRHSNQLERLGFHELRCPCSESILMGPLVEEDSVGADDQQLSEVAISHF